MLKRKTGIILLTLLFVTGLAGTISDNIVSKSERKVAITKMKATYKDAVEATKGLSEIQLNYKESTDKWSVKECFYHIAASEKLLWAMFEKAMSTPANPEQRTAIIHSDEQVAYIAEDRSKKNEAPDLIQPKNTNFNNISASMLEFKMNRDAHINYMKNTTEDLRNHVIQFPFGWIDCYQLYLYIASHNNRHIKQMNEVKASSGFPLK